MPRYKSKRLVYTLYQAAASTRKPRTLGQPKISCTLSLFRIQSCGIGMSISQAAELTVTEDSMDLFLQEELMLRINISPHG